jgi:chemotaxis protein CheZ
MRNLIMGNIDGEIERLAFEPHDIERIIPRYVASLVFSSDGPDLLLELNGKIFTVQGKINKDAIRPYFIILESGVAFNSTDYQILFNIEELPNNIISGISVNGQKHICKIHTNAEGESKSNTDILLSVKKRVEKLGINEFSSEDAEQLKEVIQKMKKNEFFELLTMELSDKLKGVARELIDFRKDIQSKIEPDMVEMASRDIPEASNQLECINETLEESTMKIMDINEEQTEIANSRLKVLRSFLKERDVENATDIKLEDAIMVIEEQANTLKMIEDLSLKMMEPLSFQDLVGQRIQRIIKLVRSMENRIEEMIVSFGIRIKKHKEDPTRSYQELNKDVDRYLKELKGPQRAGEGLNQDAIDDLLENL